MDRWFPPFCCLLCFICCYKYSLLTQSRSIQWIMMANITHMELISASSLRWTWVYPCCLMIVIAHELCQAVKLVRLKLRRHTTFPSCAVWTSGCVWQPDQPKPGNQHVQRKIFWSPNEAAFTSHLLFIAYITSTSPAWLELNLIILNTCLLRGFLVVGNCMLHMLLSTHAGYFRERRSLVSL